VKISYPSRVNPVGRMTADANSSWFISQCIAGNETAIEYLVREHEAGVFRLALSIVGDATEASEITQETFLAALRSLRSYEERKSFKAWLYTIAINLSRSHLRKRKALERLRSTLTALFHYEQHEQASPEDEIILSEKEAAIWNALSRLDERHRIVVVLRYFHELPVAEISAILSVNEGTIHSRLHSARERLRQQLKDLHGE